jgi:NADPH:quinone reductase-like Zn-dependent oxidoreductase
MLVVVGYSGGREATIDVTDLIWKCAQVRGFTFKPGIFSAQTIAAAQKACLDFLAAGALQPTIAKVFDWASSSRWAGH